MGQGGKGTGKQGWADGEDLHPWRHSQVVFVNQDEQPVQGQEAEGPTCRQIDTLELQ